MKKILFLLFLLLIPAISYSQVPDTTTAVVGLLRHWTFDEANGGKAFDTIKFDTSVITGATQGVTAHFGNGVQTTKESNDEGLCSIANSFGIEGSSQCTISFWLYVSSFATSGHVNGYHTQSAKYNYWVYHNPTPQFTARFGTISADINNTKNGITMTKQVWHNIVIDFAKNDFSALYVDTVFISSVTTLDNTAIASIGKVGHHFSYDDAFNVKCADAIYDDMTVWNIKSTPDLRNRLYTNDWSETPATATNKQNTRIVIH